MKDIERIMEMIKSHKAKYGKDFCVKEIGVFGSYARNEERPDSDLDVLVEFERPVDLFRFLELEERLSELTHKRVDLVSKKALKPHIGKEILRTVIYI